MWDERADFSGNKSVLNRSISKNNSPSNNRYKHSSRQSDWSLDKTNEYTAEVSYTLNRFDHKIHPPSNNSIQRIAAKQDFLN